MTRLLRRYIRALRKIHQLEKANRMLAEQLYLNHRPARPDCGGGLMVKDPIEFERRRQAYIDRKWAKKGAEARAQGNASLGPNSAPANKTTKARLRNLEALAKVRHRHLAWWLNTVSLPHLPCPLSPTWGHGQSTTWGMKVETEMTLDDCVKVTVEVDNMRATGWVSSFHLVDPKVAQLKEMITRAAAEALAEAAA